MLIKVQQEDFEPDAIVNGLCEGRTDVGAVVTFLGLVREFSKSEQIQSMTLEHYPGMTEKALQTIVEEAQQRWQLMDVAVIHRVGDLKPADRIVMVAVSSAHRGDAFKACEFIIDYLKTRAPFWKKEINGEGEHWVEARESDDAAVDRWSKD
ncbi:MAG: molybdopterin synthase catalytic subunit MoaE [Gammaproteobacteria bacterium]|nr:MAG: molybdopterin synthase catalytic subunit MoaE [Gammaproteobacteria bacterium]